MKKATLNDKTLVLDLLTQAFDDNSSVNYIVKQDYKRSHRIRALMDYSFEVCFRLGEIWLSDDLKGCALMLYRNQTKSFPTSIWLDMQLIFRVIGINRIGKALKREALIKAKQPKKEIAYLWFIAVSPIHQQRGCGSRLLKEVLDHAKCSTLPVYLETSTERNLPWYKKHGFITYDTLDLGYKLHFLKYEPVK
jgi:ribosomal protein S18 acetylase RimI-like enzyme